MGASGERPSGILGDLLCEDLNDACCWACSGGGDVVCCDGCRAVYHLPCIGLKQLPENDWFCPLCHCKECSQSSRTHQGVHHISTRLIPVKNKSLQPRQSPQQRLPIGPGYLCPQQVRKWLTQQLPAIADAPASSAQDSAASQAEGHKAVDQHRSKRHKLDPGNSSGSVSLSSSHGDGLVRCCCCQQACHINCLPTGLRQQYLHQAATPAPQSSSKFNKVGSQQQREQQLVLLKPYFCSPSCQQVASHMAERCAQGLVQVDALADGTPVCWQLIQPAAVAAALLPPPEAAAAVIAASFAGSPIKSPPKAASTPEKGKKKHGGKTASEPATVGLLGTGIAPAYSRAQAEVLAQVLRDVQQLMQQQLGPAWEVRTFQDTLPWIISGLRCHTPGGLLDLSHFHVAALWVGSTLSAAALVRVHGTAMLEVSQVATLEQLQHKQLGRLLVSCVERFALETCHMKQAWMPALGGGVKPCVGVSVLPSWERPPGAREALQLSTSTNSSLQLLGLRVEHTALPAAGTSSGQQQQQVLMNSQQQTPKEMKSCWALQLSYGPAPSVADWLEVPKHLLLRYSYVPFVTKRLRPETLVPLPRFKKQEQRAGPASAGGAVGATAGQQVTPGHAAAGGSVSTGAAAGPVKPATDTPGGQGQHHTTCCSAEHHQCAQPQHSQQLKQQVFKAPLTAVHSSEQQHAVPGVNFAPSPAHGNWCQRLEQGAPMFLQPQLHQLPPRNSHRKVLQEHMQQQQQQLVTRQLKNAARLPLADAGHSFPATVDARIAAGIAAYGSVGSVVGVAGIQQQQQT